MTIGQRIKTSRQAAKMTQTELADRIGVCRSTIVKYESGAVTDIPNDNIAKLAVVLDTSVKYLIGFDDDRDSIVDEDGREADKTRAMLIRMVDRMTREEREELLKFAKYMWLDALAR